jgi:hypothetical protein
MIGDPDVGFTLFLCRLANLRRELERQLEGEQAKHKKAADQVRIFA